MKASIYINELDIEVEFEGTVQQGFSDPGDSTTPPYFQANQWRVWWDTTLYTAEQNGIIEGYEGQAEQEMEELWDKEYSDN